MAKIADVLATERNRQQPQEWSKIHLFQMGDFYRAYEWSAWLIVAITYSDKVRHQQQGDRKPLKVSKKTLASGGSDFCFVGFPIKSLEKFVPERTDFTSTEEKHIVVTIQLPQPTDGTHYGISRLRHHIRQATHNWQQPSYALSLDIRGYFMHIDRQRLLKIATASLLNMSTHRVGLSEDIEGIPSGVLLTPTTTWADIRDFSFILWLTEQIVMLDPMAHCQIVGDLHDWDDIDHAKCMRFVEPGLALPIGNLTSQLFSNVYLNPFDQFVKRDILCRHYGRYVDDSTQIDPDRDWLLAQVPREREFLADELGLQLHMGKLHIREVHQGVEFLGAFLKPYRDYVSRRTLERMTTRIQSLDLHDEEKAQRTMDSYLGILSHTASRHIAIDLGLTSKPMTA